MASDRDIDGMIPQNWPQANTSGIDAVKITSKDDNIQLFDGIKQIMSEAVNILRSDANDSKVKYIVDLIMMRVRAAISNQITSNNDFLLAEINKTVKDLVEKNKDKQTQNNSTDNIISELPLIVEQILNDVSKNKKEIQEEKNNDTEKNIDEQKNNQIKTDANIDNKVNQTINIQKFLDILNSSIKQLEENIHKNMKLIGNIGKNTISQSKNTLSGKQYKGFLNVVNARFKDMMHQIDKLQLSLVDTYNDINEQLIKINKTLDKLNEKGSGFLGIMLLLMAVGGLALMFFWDKISAKINEWKKTSKIWQAIQVFVQQIKAFINDPIGYINDMLIKVVASLTTMITKFLTEKFSDPLGFIKNEITQLWDNFKMFGQDVWGWITGAKKEVTLKKDESEKAAAKSAEESLNEQQAKLDQTISQNQDATIDRLNKEAERQNQMIQQTTTAVEKDSAQLSSTVEKNAAEVTKNAEEATKDLDKNVFPNIESNVAASTDSSLKQIDEKTSQQITESTKKLDDAAKNIEKTAAANGPPTNVDTATLDKMQGDASAAGGNVDVKPGEKAKMPADIVKSTANEQDKTISLYSNKKDVDEANKNTAEIAALPSNSVPEVKNDTPKDGDTSKSVIENKLVVVGPDGKILDVKALQEKRAAFDNLVEILSKNEEELKSSNKLLSDLKNSINNYFSELNNGIRDIARSNSEAQQKSSGNNSEKPKINNTVVVVGNDNTSDADLEDK